MTPRRKAALAGSLALGILTVAGWPPVARWESDDIKKGRPTQATPAVTSERIAMRPPFRNKVSARTLQRHLAAIAEQPGDLLDIVTNSIDAMTSEEVVAALTQLTGRDREAIEEIDDPHEFSKSLAQAVLSGWMTESDMDADTSVFFSTRLNGEDAHPDEQVFASSATRIFGSFPLQPGEERTVLAKWYQVDTSEMLLLQELPVREQDGQGFIRLDRSEGWPEGSYRLELYDPAETVTPFAMGEYQTQGHARPLTVTFR